MTGTHNFKIAIDTSPLNDGNSIRGIGYYVQSLISHLQREINDNPKYNNFQVDLIHNPQVLQNNHYDLIHYPYFDPFQLTLPLRPEITIVTVYDLIPRQFKSHYPVGLKGEIKWLIQRRQLKKTNYIITSSDYSKYTINQIIKYPLDRIFTIYGAADDGFKIISDHDQLKKIRDKYNLPPKFVLFVGDINWNKNIPTLVKSCQKLNYPLVIVGSSATKSNVENHPWTRDLKWLQQTYQQLRSQNTNLLTLTGFVPENELPTIFNLATIYCQPSYAEGFGIPLVQAMKCGCPTVYSQETCLPEIMDFCGLPFNPYSSDNLIQNLKNLWGNSKLQAHYSKLGLKRAKFFSWSNSAKQTLALYQLALL